MSYNFSLGDCISRLNSARASRLVSMKVNKTKANLQFLKILKEIGIFSGIMIVDEKILVYFKYNKGICSFRNIKLISKPGKKVYWNLTQIARNIEKSSATLVIVSTSYGLLLGTDCLIKGCGGKPLVKIYF